MPTLKRYNYVFHRRILACPWYRRQNTTTFCGFHVGISLVLNMVVLWTTRYLDAAVNYRKQKGFDARNVDVERLLPLVSHHINFVGKYHFTPPEEVMRGELRPFHNPDDPDNII